MEKILILGGTNFIGRNLVEKLISKDDYELTLLNRGITNSKLFPKIENIIGDRDTNRISKLIKGNWDYIIDLSCYYPSSLDIILKSLSKCPKKYIFISTCSVYENEKLILRNESASIQKLDIKDYDDNSLNTYGKRKSKCEELLKKCDINFTILRPSLVYGKYDNTDRFYFWLHQIQKYPEILIPNEGTQKFSITYVQDLIEAILLSINSEKDRNIYNIISHPEVSISKIVKVASKLLMKSPEIINISSKTLKDNNIKEWMDLPLWIDNNYFTFDNKKILEEFGLDITPFEKSIGNTIKFYSEKLHWPEPNYGINRYQQLKMIEYSKKETTANKG